MSLRVIASLLVLAGPVVAQEESLPTPRPLAPPVTVIPDVPHRTGFYLPNRYAIWQYYDPARTGGWRPRVVWTPDGAYYSATGAPYYWSQNYPRWWQPPVMGTPYRSLP